MADDLSHNSIWPVLDRVLGQMPTHEIGVALAALIFLRWVDFEEAEREAIAACEDVSYEPVLPAELHWRSWCNEGPKKLETLIGELPNELRNFADRLDDSFARQLSRAANGLEPLKRMDSTTLSVLVRWLAQQPFETPTDRMKLRNVLDEVLQKSSDKKSGQFVSPPLFAKLMAGLARPQAGESIYDPCFGSGKLLTSAVDLVLRRSEKSGNKNYRARDLPLKVAGVERVADVYLIGLTRLVLSGVIDPQLELGNSLERVAGSNPSTDGFDIVLTNPPWGSKVDLQDLQHYPIQSTDSTVIFVQHALARLRPGGRAVIAVPPSLLFRKGREEELRRMLVLDNTVEAVVSIPRGSLGLSVAIDVFLLLLRRGGKTKTVRMVDAKSDFEKLRRSGMTDNMLLGQIDRLIRTPDEGQEYWDVNLRSLESTHFDLTPKRRNRSSLQKILESLPSDLPIMTLADCCEIRSGRNIRGADLLPDPNAKFLTLDQAASMLGIAPETVVELRSQGELFGYRDGATLKFRRDHLTEIARERGVDQRLEVSIPYVRIGDVNKGVASSGSSFVNPIFAETLDAEWRLCAGDLLISKSGTIGKTGIVRNGAVGAIASSGFFVLKTDSSRLDPHFLLAFLQSAEVNAWLDDHARGSAARHLAMSVIRELPIPLPPLQIQQRVAEECRKFGVDALTYLAELVSEDQSDALPSELNDWVASNAKVVDGIPLADRFESFLEAIQSIANSGCPVNLCEKCGRPYHLNYSDRNHIECPVNYAAGVENTCLPCWLDVGLSSESMEEMTQHSPLVPWAIVLHIVMEPMKRVTRIPDMSTVYGLLQSTKTGLAAALDKIQGNLPSEQRARELTENISRLIDSQLSRLTNDTKLVIDVVGASLLESNAMRVSLRITNASRLPLNDLDFQIQPRLTPKQGSRFPFLGPGSSIEIDFYGDNQWHSDDQVTALQWTSPDISLRWSGRTIGGQLFRATQDLAIDFHAALLPGDTAYPASTTHAVGSPYICGDPVKPERSEMFFGRDELLKKIRRSVIESGNVVLLEGNRRAGKSSVLWHLEGATAIPGWLGVYCSLQGAEGDSRGGIPTAEVFRSITYAIVQSVRKLNGSSTLPDGTIIDQSKKLGVNRAIRQGIGEESPFQDFREYLELMLEQLAEQNLGILLMLDEFDKLQEGIDNKVTSPQVPENIRFLVQSLPRFSAILTGSRRLKRMRQEYWSALFGLGTRFGVTSLPKADAERLIVEPVKRFFSFAKPAVEQCYMLTAGQPYLLQCLCNRIFDSAISTGLKSITVDHIDRAAEALVKDNEHFASLWDYTEFDRRRFLLCLLWKERNSDIPMKLGVIEAKLEEAGVELREELLIEDLEELIELELIDRNGESSAAHYSLSIPMMGQWIDSQQDIDVLRSRALGEAEDFGGISESNHEAHESIQVQQQDKEEGKQDD